MRKTPFVSYRYDPLDPKGIVCFLVLAMLWVVWRLIPSLDYPVLSAVARFSGYAAFVGMLIPYWHIVQRVLRSQPKRRMSYWLRWHIAASYIGFAFLLVHCHGRASSPLTQALLWLTWIVMISGVIGFYGQKLLYTLLPGMREIPEEFGLERLEPERLAICESARKQLARKELAGAPALVQEFVRTNVEGFLQSPFRFWSLGRRQNEKSFAAVEERDFTHALLLAPDAQRTIVESIWKLAERRRRLNFEYRFHQLGRIWLLFHGPAAWAMLVLMLEHVWESWRYGGF
ncbi:hypothetical protein BH10PLA2_BH10PLA2_19920 [soil metagenome]